MQSADAPARPPVLPLIGLAVGLWAMVPPYVGPKLANLQSRVEIADHIVPGVVLLAVSAVCVIRARRGPVTDSFPLVAGFTVALAGLWMTATHLPLLKQAQHHEAGVRMGTAIWHTTPGVVVLVLGLAWVATTWSTTAEAPPPPPTKAGRAQPKKVNRT